MPCRINKRRAWTARLILESAMTELPSYFVSLTYAPEFLPENGSLRPKDLTLFLKRVRSRLEYEGHPNFRYFACGEYGDISQRPHYHVLFFGLADVQLVSDCWHDPATGRSLGIVDVGDCSPQSIAYVAGYTTKKMTSKDDIRLNGRHPEFIRCSRRPGIGYEAARELARQMTSKAGCSHLIKTNGVFREIRYGGKRLPLDRYMRDLILNMAGISRDRIGYASHAHALNSILDKGPVSLIEARKRGSAVRSEFQNSLRKGRKLL